MIVVNNYENTVIGRNIFYICIVWNAIGQNQNCDVVFVLLQHPTLSEFFARNCLFCRPGL